MRAAVAALAAAAAVATGLPDANASSSNRLALREVLVYERTFSDGMPDDWRPRATSYVEGEYAKGHGSQDWVYDGALVLGIKADPDAPGKYLAGHVGTQGRTVFPTPFGFYEARVRFGTAPGVLAGWWLQSTDENGNAYTTPDHRETDIAENGGNPNVHHRVWWRDGGMVASPLITFDLGSNEEQGNWHTYGVEVSPTGYEFRIDNVVTGRISMPVAGNVGTYPVLSLKVPDYLVGKLDPSTLVENRMRVDWVRKWAQQ